MSEHFQNPENIIILCDQHNLIVEYLYRDEQNNISVGCQHCSRKKDRIKFTNAYNQYQQLYFKRKTRNHNKITNFHNPIKKISFNILHYLEFISSTFKQAFQKIEEKITILNQSFLNNDDDKLFQISNVKELVKFAEKYFQFSDWLQQHADQNQSPTRMDIEKETAEYFDSIFMNLRKNFIQDIEVIHAQVLKDTKQSFQMLNLSFEILEKSITSSQMMNQEKRSILSKMNLRNEIANIYLHKKNKDFIALSANSLTLYSIENKQFESRSNKQFEDNITCFSCDEDLSLFALSTSNGSLHFGNIQAQQQRNITTISQFRRNNIKAIEFIEKKASPFCFVFEDDVIAIYNYQQKNWIALTELTIQEFQAAKFNQNYTLLAVKFTQQIQVRQETQRKNQICFYQINDLINQQLQPTQTKLDQNQQLTEYDFFWQNDSTQQKDKGVQSIIRENLYIFQDNKLFLFRLNNVRNQFELFQTITLINGKLIGNNQIEKSFALISEDNQMIYIYKIVLEKVIQMNVISSQRGWTLVKFSFNEQFLTLIKRKKKIGHKLIIHHVNLLPQYTRIPIKSPKIIFNDE